MYVIVFLAALLAGSQQPITKHIPSKNKKQQATADANNKTPSATPANTPPEQTAPTPKPEQQKSDACNNTQKIELAPQSTDIWFKSYVIFTAVIAGLNVGILFLMWLQRKAMLKQVKEMEEARTQTVAQMSESNAINRETLHAVYRAYVRFPFEVEGTRLESQEHNEQIAKTWRFWIPVVNDGQTPTKGLHFEVNWAIWEGDLPKDFTYPNHGTVDGSSRELAPKGRHLSGTIDITHAQIRSIEAKEKRLFFYGWATYNDVFEKTPLHHTFFCHEVIWIRFRDRGFDYGLQSYGSHNSSD